jgi:hypothetical protein
LKTGCVSSFFAFCLFTFALVSEALVAAILSAPRLAGLLLLMTCVADTQPMAHKPKRVKVTMVTILATERNNEVDARLKDIAAELRKMNPQLKGFKLVSMENKSLSVDEKAVFPLVDEQVAKVVIHRAADENNRIILAVTPPRQGELTWSSACGKFLPIVTRYQTEQKERLILAVRVQPCNGK